MNYTFINDYMRWWIRQNLTYKLFLAFLYACWIATIQLLDLQLAASDFSHYYVVNELKYVKLVIDQYKEYVWAGPCSLRDSATFTLCCRFDNTVCIRLIKHGWIFNAAILASTLLLNGPRGQVPWHSTNTALMELLSTSAWRHTNDGNQCVDRWTTSERPKLSDNKLVDHAWQHLRSANNSSNFLRFWGEGGWSKIILSGLRLTGLWYWNHIYPFP